MKINTLKLTVAAAVALTLCFGALHGVGAQESEAPGSITFVGKNMVATANGTFHSWKFTEVSVDWAAPADSVVEIEVDVASIDTKLEKRDDHLRNADFFEVETYPTATLKIYSFAEAGTSEAGNPQYSAKLDWSMHGVEKSYDGFTFEVTSQDPVTVAGSFTINRMDFGIGEPHKSLNPMSIKEEIPIAFEAQLPAAE